MSKGKKVRILSLDGGGIRGIISGEIIIELERKLQAKSNTDNKIGDFFDFISGTSTGGIMACSYLVCDAEGKAMHSAADVQNIYAQDGSTIFGSSVFRKWLNIIYNEAYNAQHLEAALSDFFGETMIADFQKPCLITAYDIENRCARFFNSRDTLNKEIKTINPIHNFKVKDVVRATSAAPTYFEPASIFSQAGTNYSLIDGGVFANNPSLCTYAEVRNTEFEKLKGEDGKYLKPKAKDMLLISIGTGQVMKKYLYQDLKDDGKIQWIKPIIDILMSGNTETVDYQLRQMYDTLGEPDCHDYHRLEPQLHNASSDMDDTTEENIKNLVQAGRLFNEAYESELDAIVDKILENA